jgi:hypothetical protein
MSNASARQPAGRRRSSHLQLALALLAVAALVACSENTDTATGDPQATTTTMAVAEPAVDGLDLAEGSEVSLGDGWTIEPCESGPPLFCARHDGEEGAQAVIELLSVPTSNYPAVKRALDAGSPAAEALAAQATEYHDTFMADRPAGCGAGYRVDPIGPDEAAVAGQPGVMYGFDGHQDGRHVERNVHFATIRNNTLHIVVATAIDDGTCMDDGTLAEFTTAELIELQPQITRMIAASTLP